MYVVAHTLVENLLCHWLALLVGEHPVGKLRVPTEAVSAHLYAILSAPVGYAVCSSPVPHVFFRVNLAWFHGVLSRYAIEVLLHYCHLFCRRDITEI